jgi:hypothetical protein
MHKFANSKQPITFNDLWVTNFQNNPLLVLRNVNDFHIPAHRIDLFKRSPKISFALEWNAEGESKMEPSEKVFLKRLKTRLLSVT